MICTLHVSEGVLTGKCTVPLECARTAPSRTFCIFPPTDQGWLECNVHRHHVHSLHEEPRHLAHPTKLSRRRYTCAVPSGHPPGNLQETTRACIPPAAWVEGMIPAPTPTQRGQALIRTADGVPPLPARRVGSPAALAHQQPLQHFFPHRQPTSLLVEF